jgi:heme-binding protein
MLLSARTARRAVAGAIGTGALAGVAAGVSSATSGYLFTHPDVNFFFTSLEGKNRDQVRAEVDKYMNANPMVKGELTGIRQPLVDIKNRCGDTNGDGIADTP